MGYMKLSNHKSYRCCTSERDIFLKYVNKSIPYTSSYAPKRAKKNHPYSSGSQTDWNESLQNEICTVPCNSNFFFKLVVSGGYGCSSTYSNGNYQYNYIRKCIQKVTHRRKKFSKASTSLPLVKEIRTQFEYAVLYEYKTCRYTCLFD